MPRVESEKERYYTEGHRMALRGVLLHVLGSLRCYGEPDLDGPRAVLELEATRQVLRRVCAKYGSTAWSDTLYIADVLEKHLERQLDTAASGEEPESEHAHDLGMHRMIIETFLSRCLERGVMLVRMPGGTIPSEVEDVGDELLEEWYGPESDTP